MPEPGFGLLITVREQQLPVFPGPTEHVFSALPTVRRRTETASTTRFLHQKASPPGLNRAETPFGNQQINLGGAEGANQLLPPGYEAT